MNHAQPATTNAVLSDRARPPARPPQRRVDFPTTSCTRNRPIRVPASIVVRMNSASNMIAKWYQYSHSF